MTGVHDDKGERIEIVCKFLHALSANGLIQVDRLPSKYYRKSIPLKIKEEVKSRDGDICAYCGLVATGIHIDHIIPLSKGGLDTVSNLTVSCASYNLSKGSKSLKEWKGCDNE